MIEFVVMAIIFMGASVCFNDLNDYFEARMNPLLADSDISYPCDDKQLIPQDEAK